MQQGRNASLLPLLCVVWGVFTPVVGQYKWPTHLSKVASQLPNRHYHSHINSSDDSPQQREALLTFYRQTGGSTWLVPKGQLHDVPTFAAWSWDSRKTSYCEWPGVMCCKTAQHVHDLMADLLPYAGSHGNISCDRDTDVASLFLSAAGLRGSLPDVLKELPGLKSLMLGHNPGLSGTWPRALQLPNLLFLDVQETSLEICIEGNHSRDNRCDLPSWLLFDDVRLNNMPGQVGLTCPKLVLSSRKLGQQASQDELRTFNELMQFLGVPPQQSVVASPGFFHAAGCMCAAAGQHMHERGSGGTGSNSSTSVWVCEADTPDAGKKHVIIAGICFLVGILLLLAVGYCVWCRIGWQPISLWLCNGQLSHNSGDAEADAAFSDEMTMLAKRSRFPGTPSTALAKGKGVLAVSEVLVTWVVTDIEGSTCLWEWDSVVMGAAVEQHNVVLRSLLDKHGGHEVRTDGDSFTLAFHDAADAVTYCIQAQEELLEVPWPRKLLEHPCCAAVPLGEVCAARNPDTAGKMRESGGLPLEKQGPLIMNGLRVRMGVNTGVPDDIFVHDLTEHVEYRGEEYNLTEDLADIAAGGQILMGPKTFQRWNRVFSQAAIPAGKEWRTSADASPLDMPPNPPEPCMDGGRLSQIHLQKDVYSQPTFQHSSSTLSTSSLRHGRWMLSELNGGAAGVAAHPVQIPTRSSTSCLTSEGMNVCGPNSILVTEEHRQNAGSMLLAPEPSTAQPLAVMRQLSRDDEVHVAQGDRLYKAHSPSSKLLYLAINEVQTAAEAADGSDEAEAANVLGVAFAAGSASTNSHDLDSCSLPTSSHKADNCSHAMVGQLHRMVRPRSSTVGGIACAINTAGLTTTTAAMMQDTAAAAPPAAYSMGNQFADNDGANDGESFSWRSEDHGMTMQATDTPGRHAMKNGHRAHSILHGSGSPVAEGIEQQTDPFVTGTAELSAEEHSSAIYYPEQNAKYCLGSAVQSSTLPVQSSVHSPASAILRSVQKLGSESAPESDHMSQTAQHSDVCHCPGANTQNKHCQFSPGVGLGSCEEDTNLAVRRSSMSRMFHRLSSLTTQLMKGSSSNGHDGDSALYSFSRPRNSSSIGHSTIGFRARHSSFWGSNSKSVELPDEPDGDSSTHSCNAVLLDLGYYRWRPDDNYPPSDTSGAGNVDMQATAAEAPDSLFHLVQVQSQRLAPRMLLFDWPLLACQGEDALLEQVLPGFMEAPGASSLSFTAMRTLMEQTGTPPPVKANVAIAFVTPAGLKDVQSLDPKIAQACQSLFTSVVREVLQTMGGYESKEVGGQVMAAFDGPRQAVEWALALQCALLQAHWPSELARLTSTALIHSDASNHLHKGVAANSPTAAVMDGAAHHTSRTSIAGHALASNFYRPACLFQGVRARIGIWSGPMDRVLPHGKSGRADYLGPPANRAARLMGAAQGGQILVEEGIMQQVLEEWQQIHEERSRAVAAAASCTQQALQRDQRAEANGTTCSPTSGPGVELQSAQQQNQSTSCRQAERPRFKRSESLPASPKPRVEDSSKLPLDSSRQRRRRSRKHSTQSQTGSVPVVDLLTCPSGGQVLNSSLKHSWQRGMLRPLLLQQMLHDAACIYPGTSAICPPSTPSQYAASQPCEAQVDPAVSIDTERRSTCAQARVNMTPAAQCFGCHQDDPPIPVQPKTVGANSACRLPQVLTVTPAAYQPKEFVVPIAQDAQPSSRSCRRMTTGAYDCDAMAMGLTVAARLNSGSCRRAPAKTQDQVLWSAADSAGVGCRSQSVPVMCRQQSCKALQAVLGAGGSSETRQRRRSYMIEHRKQPSLQEQVAVKSSSAACKTCPLSVQDSTVLSVSALQRARSCGAPVPYQDDQLEQLSSNLMQHRIEGCNGLTTSESAASAHAGVSKAMDPDDHCLSQLLPASAFYAVGLAAAGFAAASTTCSQGTHLLQLTGNHGQVGQSDASFAATRHDLSAAARVLGFQDTTSSETLQSDCGHLKAVSKSIGSFLDHNSSTDYRTCEKLASVPVEANIRQHPVLFTLSDSDKHSEQGSMFGNSGVTAKQKPMLRITIDSPTNGSLAQTQSGAAPVTHGVAASNSCAMSARQQLCREQFKHAGLASPASPTNSVRQTLLRNVSFPETPTRQAPSRLWEGTSQQIPCADMALEADRTAVMQAAGRNNKELCKQDQQGLSQLQSSMPPHTIPQPSSAPEADGSAGNYSAVNSISNRETVASKYQAGSSIRQVAGPLYSYMQKAGNKLRTGTAAQYRTYTQDDADTDDSQPPCTSSASAPDLCSSSVVGRPAGSRNNKPSAISDGNARRGNLDIPADMAVRVPSAASSVWEAFISTIRSATGGSPAFGVGGIDSRHTSHESQLQYDKDGSQGAISEPTQHALADKDTVQDGQDPSIMAECFKITSGVVPGIEGPGPQSITMIKYTALKQQMAQEAASEMLPLARRLAATTFSSYASTVGASTSMESTSQTYRWAEVCVNICVHQVGGFRLKGVDKVANVVQVMPTSLAGRMQWLLSSNSTRGKCHCVAPASGLVADCQAYLPDLSQLMNWINASALSKQPNLTLGSQVTEQSIQQQSPVMLEEKARTVHHSKVQDLGLLQSLQQEGVHGFVREVLPSPLRNSILKGFAALSDSNDPQGY